MRPRLFASLTGAGLACFLASSLAAQPVTHFAQGMKESVIDPQEAYTEWRWVGIHKGGGCPAPTVAGWDWEPLLAQAATELDQGQNPERAAADEALLRKLELDRFCVYTRTSGSLPFDPPPGLVKAGRDRMALSASGLEEIVSPALTSRFLSQTGGVSPVPLRPQDPGVRLVFIDSHPTGDGISPHPPGGSRHGYTLAHLANRLVCGGTGPCAAGLGTRRALNLPDSSDAKASAAPPALAHHLSGRVGVVGDLADAIVAEVVNWRQKGLHERLILNISLGWDGELFRDLDAHGIARLEPSVRAVYQALQFASSRGVLVIAAAGNRRGGPEPSTLPLLPAAWELRRPCALPFGLGRKLVYSVGGVDGQDLPLPNHRHGGRPRRSAYGDHAVAKVDGGATAILTGSSVSSAVVSSIAAVIWHLRPELRPDQVMSMIDRSGSDLTVRADFYPWRSLSFLPAPRQRRLSLCKAVARACGPDAARCPGLTSPVACEVLEELSLPPFPAVTPVASLAPPDLTIHPEPPCHPRTSLRTPVGAGPLEAPCPTDQFGSVTNQRWVFPQPDEVPCPGCTLVPDPPSRVSALDSTTLPAGSPQEPLYTLTLEISPDWTGLLKSEATLDIDCFENGMLVKRLTKPVTLPAAGTMETLPLSGLGDGLLGCTAQLNFVVKGDKPMSVQNPVAVEP